MTVSAKQVKDYKDLIVWQKGICLVKSIYGVSKDFPKEEMFGLTNQMRRAAVSIPCNIAEGWMRQHRKEYIQFLHHSLGSCGELETQIIIANHLAYIAQDVCKKLLYELDYIIRMLRNLTKKLSNHESDR